MKSFFGNLNRAKKKLKIFFKEKKSARLVFVGVVFALLVFAVSASFEKGNIDSENKFAWNENTGWINFGNSGSTVEVSDTGLLGYAWSENAGWVSLSCANDNSCGTSDFGVKNDSEGTLSGYAFGENVGWINFSPSNGGVKIGSDGNFSGYAWGENIGWLIFGCETTSSCSSADWRLKTDWRPASVRAEEEEDSKKLKISDIETISTTNSITIEWKTNRKSDSHLRWGIDQDLKKEKDEDRKEKSHRIVLRGLVPETKYYFRLKSTDADGLYDSTRIHSAFTKTRSNVLVSYPFGSSRREEPSEDIEEVEVKVSDEKPEEAKKEEIAEEKPVELSKPVGETAEIGESLSSRIAKPFKFIGGKISGFFSGLYDNTAQFAATVRDGLLSGQKKIAGIFENLKSESQEAKKQFFTTEIFKNEDVKTLAEVKFQLLDRQENPISDTEATLASEPETSSSDENGIVAFHDVEIGEHTLSFSHLGDIFRKKVAIADTLTEEGKVRMEVVQVKAEKEKVALWMWIFAILMILAVAAAVFFAGKYYKLKNNKKS